MAHSGDQYKRETDSRELLVKYCMLGMLILSTASKERKDNNGAIRWRSGFDGFINIRPVEI